MQKAQRAVEDVEQHGARDLAIVRLGVGSEPSLHGFEIPIGELIPHEPARGLGVLVETQPGVPLVSAPVPAVGIIGGLRRLQRAQRPIALGDRSIEALEHP